MSLGLTTVVTALLIVASAYFVILEFSLLAARRHRLEETAETSSASRAALRSLNELTMMLAGAQLGITGCTFALGAITKPAVHYALTPLFESWSMPAWVADAVAFGVALLFVTFLHLVVGEMAPKSWAIAHPEFSARVVALPTRVFMWPLRPLLGWLNTLANRLVAATGVEPVDRAAAGGYDAQTIRQLVDHSSRLGVLDQEAGAQISGIIELEDLTVDHLLASHAGRYSSVPETVTVSAVQAEARTTDSARVLLTPDSGPPSQIVHVRETLLAHAHVPAVELARPVMSLESGTTVQEAFRRMRTDSEQVAVVRDGDDFLGVITWNDVLTKIWPQAAVDQGAD